MNGNPDERHDDRDRDRRLELLRDPRPRSSAGPAFFGALFSWQFAASNVPGYFMIPNADPSAGLTTTDEDSGGHTYFTVPDIEAATTRVREFGGEAAAPLQVPSGTFARRRDDQGTEFGLWQEPRGLGLGLGVGASAETNGWNGRIARCVDVLVTYPSSEFGIPRDRPTNDPDPLATGTAC